MRAWRKSGGNRHRKRAQILLGDVPDELNHLLRESKPRNRRLGPFQLRSRESELLLRDLAQAHDIESEEDDTHAVDDEGEEHLKDKFLPLYAQIAQMTVSQKIRRAQVGTAAERLLLVRDTNRLVASAAVKSPAMRENEAVIIAASRNVGEDVLREIARNREFTRNYQVKLNLSRNPRCPFTFSARIIPLLRDNDLRDLAKSKNVPSSVQQAARQQLERKRGGKG